MITVNYRRRLRNGVAPYSYSITGDNSCVSITPNTGISYDGNLNFRVVYDNENCLANTEINITGADSNGCSFNLTVVDPTSCDNLIVNPIVFEAPYTFTVSASRPGCTQGLSFRWDYDTTIFDLVSNSVSAFTSELTLIPRSDISMYPDTSEIFVTVTDCIGCQKVQVFNFSFCQPQARNINTNLFCQLNSSGTPIQMYRRTIDLAPLTGCTGVQMDWTSFSISNPYPQLVGIFNNALTGNNGGAGTITMAADLSLQGQTLDFFYSVATVDGIRSTQGRLRVKIGDCSSTDSIFLESSVVNYDCDAVPGDIVYFYIDPFISTSPGTIIDWNSFQILSSPTYSSPNIELDVDLNGDRRIAYTLPDPIVTETFSWSVCSTTGNCATASFFTVVECTDGPIAVDDEACSICGEQIEINVLTNDTEGDGAINASTLTVLAVTNVIPNNPAGTAISTPSGTIIYTPPFNMTGTVEITYQVRDVFNTLSNVGTVTVDIICAGNDTIISVCQ